MKAEAQGSALYAAAQRERARLIRREEGAVNGFSNDLRVAKSAIEAALDDLDAEILALEERGTPVMPYQWEQWDQLRRTEVAVSDALRDMGQPAAESVRKAQELATAEGVAGAARLGKIAGAVQWEHPQVQAIEALAGFMSDGSPLRAHFEAIGPETAVAIREAVAAGIAAGEGAADIAERIRATAGMGLTRAETVARTETLRAYREATRQSYEANADILDGWIRVCSGDRRTCAACWALHGTRKAVQEPCATHPRCFVAGTMTHARGVAATSERWYVGEVVDIRVLGGNVITVTPNHPILTTQGWVKAGEIVEGMDIISTERAHEVLSVVSPDDDHVYSAIEDVVKSLGGPRCVRAEAVEVSAEDFHGDGAGTEIAVIRTNRFLRGDGEPERFEPGAKEHLGGGMGHAALFSSGSTAAEAFERYTFAAYRGVGGGSVGAVLLGGSAGAADLVGGGLVSGSAPGSDDVTADDVPGNAERIRNAVLGLAGFVADEDFGGREFLPALAGESVFTKVIAKGLEWDSSEARSNAGALAGLVQADSVIEVFRRDFEGHVYNLQTSAGWYIANGLISHNCRCVMVPEVTGVPQSIPSAEDLMGRMDEAGQREALGSSRYELWRGGTPLSAFGAERVDARWGPVAELVPLGVLRT